MFKEENITWNVAKVVKLDYGPRAFKERVSVILLSCDSHDKIILFVGGI